MLKQKNPSYKNFIGLCILSSIIGMYNLCANSSNTNYGKDSNDSANNKISDNEIKAVALVNGAFDKSTSPNEISLVAQLGSSASLFHDDIKTNSLRYRNDFWNNLRQTYDLLDQAIQLMPNDIKNDPKNKNRGSASTAQQTPNSTPSTPTLPTTPNLPSPTLVPSTPPSPAPAPITPTPTFTPTPAPAPQFNISPTPPAPIFNPTPMTPPALPSSPSQEPNTGSTPPPAAPSLAPMPPIPPIPPSPTPATTIAPTPTPPSLPAAPTPNTPPSIPMLPPPPPRG